MSEKTNIIIEQGTHFTLTIDLSDPNDEALDVSGLSACAQIRTSYSNSSAHDFTTVLETGKLTISMDANTSSNVVPRSYVWDVKLLGGTDGPIRLVEGKADVTPQVSR